MEAELHFTADDDFYDHDQAWDLPDCAVALLSRAGSWSARNRRNGFVPSSMPARFTSDPVQAAEELCRRHLWRRVRGGYQFTVWERWGETTEQIDRKREGAAERQRRSRATRKEKAQVKPGDVTRDMRVTSRDKPLSDDQDHLSGVNQVNHPGDLHARTREEPPWLVGSVAAKAAERAGRIVSDDEARRAIAEIRDRAEQARKVIHDDGKYILAAIENEPDIFLLILGDPDALEAALTEAAPPPPGTHPFEFDPRTSACAKSGCELPRSHARHAEAKEARPA